MNYVAAFHRLRQSLTALYDNGEAAAIAREVLMEVTGLSYTEGLVQSDSLSGAQMSELACIGEKLLAGMPLQYVLGRAYFMGRKFMVNGHVLIPRPETEELVQWILDDWKDGPGPRSILDVGTGSGCIPVSLKLARQDAVVTACDVSKGALDVAQHNANELMAEITFLQMDFLDEGRHGVLPSYNIIVSNPPYIPIAERNTLHPNVREFEPGTALFVPDADPLLFYRAIAAFGHSHLKEGGAIYCELHADYAVIAKEMFGEAGYYSVVLHKDISGHDRMLKAMREG